MAAGPIEVSLWLADGKVLLPAQLHTHDGPDGRVRFGDLARALVEQFQHTPTFVALPEGDPRVVLDPSVTVVGDRRPSKHLLLSDAWATTMVVPEGDGLLDLIESLREPTLLSDLAEEFDDEELVRAVVGNLADCGFAHALEDHRASAPDFPLLRHRAAPHLRGRERARLELHAESIDSAQALAAAVRDEPSPPVVVIHAAAVAPFHALLDDLCAARRDGSLRLHDLHLVTADECITPTLAASLLRAGVRVYFGTAQRWERASDSETSLVAAGVNVTRRVRLTASDLLDRGTLDELARQVVDGQLAGLSIEAPLHAPSLTDAVVDACVSEVARLNESLGDVEYSNLASDEEVLGNEHARAGTLLERGASADAADRSGIARLRHAHLRAVTKKLRKRENRVLWAQIPEAEDLWVKSREDLLPNNPDLLGVGAGATIVDFCGGMGRVARRLEPIVGSTGTVISMEREDLIVERARHFAARAGRGNIQFRKGLAQRVALPDAFADATVNEWTGAIWQLGLGPAMLSEMARIVKPGGRVAVTHRLVILRLDELLRPTSAIANIYRQVMDAFAAADLEIVEERVWGQKLPQFYGAPLKWLVEEYLPRIYDLLDGPYDTKAPDRADTYLTVIGRRAPTSTT